MSVVTFLIGNGFDLACGLRSKFTHTYDEYVKSASKNDNIRRFKQCINSDIPTWADFEMKMADYAKTLPDERAFIECINDYKEFLNRYLLREQGRFNESLAFDITVADAARKEMEKSIDNFYDGITPNDRRIITSVLSWPRVYCFISFNYTTVLDYLVRSVFTTEYVQGDIHLRNRQQPVVHIHGTLNNDVVLGVDNENQLIDLPYSLSPRGKRKYIKPVFVEKYDDQRKQDALQWLNSSDVICIFGMALGDSDLTWKKELGGWLKENERHHLVYYKHSLSCKEYPLTDVTEKMDDEEDAKESFITSIFGDELNEASSKQMMNQIHIPAGVSLFRIEEAIKKPVRLRTKGARQSKRGRH